MVAALPTPIHRPISPWKLGHLTPIFRGVNYYHGRGRKAKRLNREGAKDAKKKKEFVFSAAGRSRRLKRQMASA